jgi:hypothetical protein
MWTLIDNPYRPAESLELGGAPWTSTKYLLLCGQRPRAFGLRTKILRPQRSLAFKLGYDHRLIMPANRLIRGSGFTTPSSFLGK